MSASPSPPPSTRGIRYFTLVVVVIIIFLLMYISSQDMHGRVLIPPQNVPVTPRPPPPEDLRLDLPEQLQHDFTLGGATFDDEQYHNTTTSPLSSFLLYSFSPWLEQEVEAIFLDPAHQNRFYVNSPAITWHRGRLVIVFRIWLNRERFKEANMWPYNDFLDNYLYTQQFDRQMLPLTNGTIMGIPTPKQWVIGDGALEPRVFESLGHLLVSFNTAMSYNKTLDMDNTVFWDYERQRPIMPHISGGSPMVNISEAGAMPRDKHWTPLLHTGGLYFVYTLDPLRILRCRISGFCWFVHSNVKHTEFQFDHITTHLRGGTPFEHYQGSYFISVAHSTFFKESNNHRLYGAHLVVLRVEPYRVVYVSEDLQVHPQLFADIPIVRKRWIEDNFIFPVGLILETPDSMVVGVHLNDHSGVLLRFRGLRALMTSLMDRDATSSPTRGPRNGLLQRYVHANMEKKRNVTFFY